MHQNWFMRRFVVKVLDGTLSAKQAVGLLMGREATEEL
jgi:hypothetical protein